jgi:hypothetical protein
MSSKARLGAPLTNMSPVALLVYGFLIVSTISYLYITYHADILTRHTHQDFVAFFITHLSLIIPEVIVWTIAALGGLRLKAYAESAQQDRDGVAFNYIADAVLLLVVYSVAMSIATSVKILFVHTGIFTAATICTVHIPVLLVLLSSIYLYVGTLELNRIAARGNKRLSNVVVELALGLFVVGVAAFIWYFYVVAPTRLDDDELSHFALPVNVLLLTYVVPHIVTWLLGLLACLHLAHYAHNVKGTIYKALLRDLQRGIMVVFACTYIVQILYISQISSRHFTLALLPVFLAILALFGGYWLIYRGADKMQQLEAR